jgi:hypothetical protein
MYLGSNYFNLSFEPIPVKNRLNLPYICLCLHLLALLLALLLKLIEYVRATFLIIVIHLEYRLVLILRYHYWFLTVKRLHLCQRVIGIKGGESVVFGRFEVVLLMGDPLEFLREGVYLKDFLSENNRLGFICHFS